MTNVATQLSSFETTVVKTHRLFNYTTERYLNHWYGIQDENNVLEKSRVKLDSHHDDRKMAKCPLLSFVEHKKFWFLQMFPWRESISMSLFFYYCLLLALRIVGIYKVMVKICPIPTTPVLSGFTNTETKGNILFRWVFRSEHVIFYGGTCFCQTTQNKL